MTTPTPRPVNGGMPALVARITVLAVVAAVVAVLASLGTAGGPLVVTAGLGVVAALLPASAAPALVIAAAAVLVALGGADPFDPGVLALIPLVHLVHVLCALAALLPMGARLHIGALRAAGTRFLVVQAVTFALVGAVALVPRDSTAAPLEIAALIAVAVLAPLVGWLARRP